MDRKEILVPLFVKGNCAAYKEGEDYTYSTQETAAFAEYLANAGADALVVFDYSKEDQEHDASIGLIREIGRAVDIPVYGGGNIRRMEDVKKLLYAGCRKVFLNYAKDGNIALTKEVSDRFGKEKILASVMTEEALAAAKEQAQYLDGILVPACLAADDSQTELVTSKAAELANENDTDDGMSCSVIFSSGSADTVETAASVLQKGSWTGLGSVSYTGQGFDFMELKHGLHARGFEVNLYDSSLSWEEIKTNSDGLLPVVVQDYKTLEVLMVAYMNQEAFDLTVRTGRMTYWSRSRQEIWVKGLTSGHFQYVKELAIDCDNDTLLAKVSQVGAACHTGNRTCFYRSILKKEYDDTNPMKVFEDVYAVIEDRKKHPKEGSYTNYLFDKGVDKILKKLGEEATEIVIAAKNPDPEEIKYEMSDFLYHAMVLMVERGVTWDDITKELARR